MTKIKLALSDAEKKKRQSNVPAWRSQSNLRMQELEAAGVDFRSLLKGRSWQVMALTTDAQAMRFYRDGLTMRAERHAAREGEQLRREATRHYWKFHRSGTTLTIAFCGPITAHAADIVKEQVTPGITKIDFTINSPGGLVDEATQIVETLRGSGAAELHCHGVGSVESAAMILFCAGTTRTADPNCQFLIHNSHMATGGDGSVEQLRVAEATDQMMAEVLSRCMQISAEDCRALMGRETEFDTQQALNENLICETVDREAEAAELRQEYEELKQREAKRLLARREELATRSVPAFGCLRGEQLHQPTNSWIVLADGRLHFDGGREQFDKPRVEEPPQQYVGRSPERATAEYLESLTPQERATFTKHLEECGVYL